MTTTAHEDQFSPDPSHPAGAPVLYQHDDGRYGVAPAGVTPPDWHPAGPVEMLEQPPSGQSATPVGAPDRIFLVIDDDVPANTPFSQLAEVTWCAERVNDTDIEYVRAQPAAAMPDEIEGLRAHVALLKTALAQAERENDELRRAQPAAATVTTDAQAIRDALTNLVREAQAVADDCHRPRYARLDDAIASARAALAAPAAPQGPIHTCGGLMVRNPHPDAGKPRHHLNIGYEYECVPCLVKSRHGWAQRALKAEAALREAAAQASGQAPAASPDFPHYEMAFICRVLEGDHPEKADLDTALGMARSVRVALLKERAAQAPAASAEPVPVEIERLAINRYRPVPAGALAYKVVAGDGSRSLFSGTKDECQIVARKLTEAFLDGAHVAINAAPIADQAPQDERMETTSEHIARDIREGRFPQRSEPQRVQATEWGPMPDAGVEADAHVAVIEGDEAVRVLRWNSDVGAFSYPVGTRLYAAQAPAADGDALTQAVAEFRRAFVVAVGDKSPFARTALERLDAAVQRTTGSEK